ncbi:hypothetical protein D6D24_05031 [Aureobasidium pullulans]|uniref:Uncharacterized protein n=1 Tax=Aureobasidium pullulans TaxID=5580 RepID=A0A4S8VTL4_AURPU|nr:hypothetical protein D6D24_05031 [Aureobasidium pullulans]
MSNLMQSTDEMANTIDDGQDASQLDSYADGFDFTLPLRFTSHHGLVVASLSGANNIKHDAFVRQALEDGRYYVRDWTRLHTGWTSQDSNLECNHAAPWRRYDGRPVKATTIAAYEHMFGEPGVLCCEDGRSALCRIWHHNLKICRKCDTLYCGPCGKMHEDPAKENTKHRARPAALKRKAKRAIERGL